MAEQERNPYQAYDSLADYNAKHPRRGTLERVTFYFGQMVTSEEADGGNAKVER